MLFLGRNTTSWLAKQSVFLTLAYTLALFSQVNELSEECLFIEHSVLVKNIKTFYGKYVWKLFTLKDMGFCFRFLTHMSEISVSLFVLL